MNCSPTRSSLHHRQQPILGNEQDAAIFRIVDGVYLADSPRLAHVGAAGEHAAVEKGLDADDAQPGCPSCSSGMLGARRFLNVVLTRLEVADGADVMRDGDRAPSGHPWSCAASGRAGSLGTASRSATRRQADGVVVLEEPQSRSVRSSSVAVAGRTAGSSRSACNFGGCRSVRRFSDPSRYSRVPPSVTLKSLSMPLSFNARELSEASGPVANSTGILGGGLVQLGPRRIALLLERV